MSVKGNYQKIVIPALLPGLRSVMNAGTAYVCDVLNIKLRSTVKTFQGWSCQEGGLEEDQGGGS